MFFGQSPRAMRNAAAALIVTCTAAGAQAGPGGERGHRESRERGMPPQAHRAPVAPDRWFDGAHGHNHSYPAPGFALRSPPQQAHAVFWGGVNYRFHEGVWYTPGPRGYVVVRPPYGVVVDEMPLLRTVVLIGGLTYLYANGVYYRQVPQGYEVVPAPVEGAAPAPMGPDKTFVYPRNGQGAQQQASDEYECHRWAVGQTGFDPTATATGQAGAGGSAQRADYQRARTACLEGRGYTVR